MPVSGEAAALVFLAENDHPEIYRGQMLVPSGSMRKVKSSDYRLFLATSFNNKACRAVGIRKTPTVGC